MTTDMASEALSELTCRAAADLANQHRRGPRPTVAAAIISNGQVSAQCAGGAGFDISTPVELGSLTKPMTGTLLGSAIVERKARDVTTLGEVFELDGPAAAITLGDLATHRSGLPRLPPPIARRWPQSSDDPYASISSADLLRALRRVRLGHSRYVYSNFGYMILGLALETISGETYGSLLESRVTVPLAMEGTILIDRSTHLPSGLSGKGRPRRSWTMGVNGAGGVAASITDLVKYVAAHLNPPQGRPGAAIRLASMEQACEPPMGYGWHYFGNVAWHNGMTAGFQSFAAFHRPSHTATVILANSGVNAGLDRLAMRSLFVASGETPPE